MSPHTTIHRAGRLHMTAGVSIIVLIALGAVPLSYAAHADALNAAATQQTLAERIPTETPIKHIIYIVGENRSFDNIYGTYQPKRGQKIWNLLSQGIVKRAG